MDERFRVTYQIVAPDREQARQRALGIALEQTVEIPLEVVPEGFVQETILGRLEELSPLSDDRFSATISYSPASVGTELSQLLNVMFGNSSIQQGIRVTGFSPSPAITRLFPGPRFGISGIRRLTGRARGGLVCPVIKPQGQTTDVLADLCHDMALAGADIVKEDHGLANQQTAPVRTRIPALVAATARANARRRANGDTTRALYFPTLCAHAEQFFDLAFFAREAGADGVLIMPGLYGFDTINRLARHPDFNLPIMAHPANLGAWVLSPDHGYSHAMMFGTLMRLAGADISIFPNVGGRFGFSADQCRSIASACTCPDGIGKPILPSPGGGMTLERIPELRAMYGSDSAYLMGGSLLDQGKNLGRAITDMRTALD